MAPSSPTRYHFPTEPTAHPDAVVKGDHYRFTVLTDGLIRIEWARDGKFEDRASTFAIRRKLAVPEYRVQHLAHGQVLEIETKRFRLHYDLRKFSAKGLAIELRGHHQRGIWHYGDEIKDLGGTIRTLDKVNGRGDMGHGILSKSGFGRIDDSDSFLFEDDGWVGTRLDGDRTDEYIFCYGREYKDAIRAFYAVSGSQPLLPRYSLGNWWTRYHKYSAAEYLELMERFEAESIPFSILVIDIYWHKVDLPPDWPGSGWTGFSWDKELIPDPRGFLKTLHEKKLTLTLNDHPAEGIRWFETVYDRIAKHMGIDPKSKQTIAFDCVDRKFLDAYFDIACRKLEDDGIDFWWVDWQQGEKSKIPSIDPLWMLNHYHFLDNSRNHKRPLLLSRFAGPGSHRYQVGFSGDVLMTWESLAFQPEFTATASNIGYGWWSHDIGGHMQGYKDDELQTRWYQLGTWSPILRLHCNNNIFNFKEPWKFGPEFRDAMSETLRFRHRLIPYLYSMNHRSAVYDDPLIQPLYWEYPYNVNAYRYPNEYFYGSELLIAPITSPRSKETHHARVDVWLPDEDKRYVDISTGLIYDGGRHLSLYRTLTQVPALANEGAIIPLDGTETLSNGTALPETIELVVVVGRSGSFDLIEDDGTGSKVDQGDFALVDVDGCEMSSPPDNVVFSTTRIEYNHEKGQLTIHPVTNRSPAIPTHRTWRIKLISYTAASSSPPTATVSSAADSSSTSVLPLPSFLSTIPKPLPIPLTLASVPTATLLTTPSLPTTSTLTISLTTSKSVNSSNPSDPSSSPTLDILNPLERIWNVLFNTNADYDFKQALWGAVSGDGSVEERVSRVRDMRASKELEGVVVESLRADGRWRGCAESMGVKEE